MRFIKTPTLQFEEVPSSCNKRILSETILVDGVQKCVLSEVTEVLDDVRQVMVSEDFSVSNLLSAGNMNSFKESRISGSSLQQVDNVVAGLENLSNLVNSVSND